MKTTDLERAIEYCRDHEDDDAANAISELLTERNSALFFLDKYHALHDMLSDAIEGGRLREEDIPDDYQAFVHQLTECCAIKP